MKRVMRDVLPTRTQGTMVNIRSWTKCVHSQSTALFAKKDELEFAQGIPEITRSGHVDCTWLLGGYYKDKIEPKWCSKMRPDQNKMRLDQSTTDNCFCSNQLGRGRFDVQLSAPTCQMSYSRDRYSLPPIATHALGYHNPVRWAIWCINLAAGHWPPHSGHDPLWPYFPTKWTAIPSGISSNDSCTTTIILVTAHTFVPDIWWCQLCKPSQ